MISNRLAGIRRKMAEANIDALLVTSRENVFYLSGFSGTSGDLLITADAAYILCDFRYTAQAGQQASLYALKDVKNGVYNVLNGLISLHNALRLGFEDRCVSYAVFSGMRNSIKNVELCPIGDMISAMRIIKDETELSNMRMAARIADTAFAETVKLMKCGMSEKEVAAELEYRMRKNGASGTSFETIVASGANSAKPHGTATEKKLEHGDLVVMDFGCIFGGYCSDMTRTVAIGEISDEKRAVYNAVLYTQLKVLGCIGEGKPCRQLDMFSRDILESFGYAEYFGHSLGHGVGIEIHEQPTLSSKSDKILQSGMVVTVEPGVYFDGKFGVRIEDTVIITDNSIENLTNSTKEIIII